MDQLYILINEMIFTNKLCCILIDKIINNYNYKIIFDFVNNDERTVRLDNFYYGSIIIKSYFVKDYINNKLIEKITISHNKNNFNYDGINY
jgi:hypothetical protein